MEKGQVLFPGLNLEGCENLRGGWINAVGETNGDKYREVTDQHERQPLAINKIINNRIITFVGLFLIPRSLPVLLILNQDCG